MKSFWKVVLGMMVLTGAALAADATPDGLVKTTTEEVIAVIKKDKDIQAGDRAKIYAVVDEKVLPHFDFERMTQLAMGRNWSVANADQRTALVKEFRQLLVRTYAVSLSQYRDQKVDFKPLRMEPGETKVTVKTEFLQPGRDAVGVDYSMEKTPAGWKVKDVVVEGVSLVTNYRSTFNDQVRQNGVDGLIKLLSDRNRAAEAKG
jgi:phospholipid transport system substrate-binding protein